MQERYCLSVKAPHFLKAHLKVACPTSGPAPHSFSQKIIKIRDRLTERASAAPHVQTQVLQAKVKAVEVHLLKQAVYFAVYY